METTFIDEPQLELRTEGSQRILAVRCVPYGKATLKAGPRPERFRYGAFAGATDNAGRIRLRDADHTRGRLPVGVAQRLEERADGLYGEFRFYNTPEGRAAVENVAAGVYAGVSVGFFADDAPVVDGVREVRAAKLHHLALCEEPAYEDAKILALRSADAYEWMRTAPTLSVDVDDTPMIVKIRQLLG